MRILAAESQLSIVVLVGIGSVSDGSFNIARLAAV
jgi:hypothetical protein